MKEKKTRFLGRRRMRLLLQQLFSDENKIIRMILHVHVPVHKLRNNTETPRSKIIRSKRKILLRATLQRPTYLMTSFPSGVFFLLFFSFISGIWNHVRIVCIYIFFRIFSVWLILGNNWKKTRETCRQSLSLYHTGSERPSTVCTFTGFPPHCA